MARKKSGSSVNKDAWLGTYGDMITLILVFFVLLYSMSTIDQQKYRLLVKAFTADKDTLEQLAMEEAMEEGEYMDPDLTTAELGQSGEQNENTEQSQSQSQSQSQAEQIENIESMQDLYEYLQQYVKENQLQDDIQVAKGRDMVYLRFTSTLFFQPNKALLLPGGKDILDDVGPALHMVEPEIKVLRIDGHTAESAPGDNTVNDRDLSTERANEVLKYLEEYYITDRAKLMAVGYGRYRPVASNDTEENRAKNRRVEILVSKVDIIQDELQTIYDTIDAMDSGVDPFSDGE